MHVGFLMFCTDPESRVMHQIFTPPTAYSVLFHLTADHADLIFSRRIRSVQVGVFSLSPIICFSCSRFTRSVYWWGGNLQGKMIPICFMSASACSSVCLAGCCCLSITCLMLTWGLVSHWPSWKEAGRKCRPPFYCPCASILFPKYLTKHWWKCAPLYYVSKIFKERLLYIPRRFQIDTLFSPNKPQTDWLK